MKALHYHHFGDADALQYGEVPDPRLGPDSVLVQVKATSVNPIDWKCREGFLADAVDTIFPVVPGSDVAGVVVETGFGVAEFAPGDHVVGFAREDYLSRGSFAHLMAVPYRGLVAKPPGLSWTEAAGLPLAGLAAYQALVKSLAVRRDEIVLVHGAAGGVGSIAVQLATHLGARVIGTASEHNHDFLRTLGAEPVAYRRGLAESMAELAPTGVDVVLDCVGKRVRRVLLPLLRPGGRLCSVVDPTVRSFGGSYLFVRSDADDLAVLVELAARGALTVAVSATFALADAAEAQRLSQAGHARGKIVVTVD